MNDKFFRKNIATYFDVSLRLQQETVFDASVKEGYMAEVLEFLRDCPREPILILKEMRITALFGFWLEAAYRCEYSVKIIIPLRHPREVSLSFGAWGVPEEISSAIWLKYMLLAERQSRGLDRVFVNYSNLLKCWQREVERISRQLSIGLKTTEKATVDEFLTGDLYRKRVSGSPDEVFGDCWISRVYALLSPATEDGAIDFRALDEMYRAFSEHERKFRLLCSGYLNQPPVRDGRIEPPLLKASDVGR